MSVYNKIEQKRYPGLPYLRIIGSRTVKAIYKRGDRVPEYEYEKEDEVVVALPERHMIRRDEISTATVNWSSMGEQSPELAASYAALIARGARLAAKANLDKEKWAEMIEAESEKRTREHAERAKAQA